jgi:hypothetical protein
MKTKHKTSNGEDIYIGDLLNTKTLKNILVLNYIEVVFFRNNEVHIENINMLKQHKDITKVEWEAPEQYVTNRIKANESN